MSDINNLLESFCLKYSEYFMLFLTVLILLFGFIFGIIIGEYQEMIYINEMINNTAYGNPSNILENDLGLFYIQPYIEKNLTVISEELPWINKNH